MQFLKHRISNTNLLSTLVRSAVVSLEVRGLGPNGTKQITCMQCVGGGEGTAWEGEETRPTKKYEDTNLQFILLKCRQISAQLNLKKRLLKKDHKLPNFNVTVVLVFHFVATVASLDRGNGQPQNENDQNFELIFRKTQHTSYVKHDMNNKWVSHFTVCAWIHTPDLQQSQKMTVISILNEDGGNHNVVRLRIDGEGNIYFSFGSDG